MLKIVVLGYGELAQSVVLGILQTKHELAGVMRWRRPGTNRVYNILKDTFVPDTLLSIIRANNLTEIKAEKANSEKFKKEMQKLKPDVIIVASWGEILKKEVIDIPRVACINCHPSLLPKHRGSNPYASAIRKGDNKGGITFHLINERIDAGDILLKVEIPITEIDNGESLRNKCAFKAKETVKVLLDRLENGKLIPIKQNEGDSSYFPPLSEDDALIDFKKPAIAIHNQIRGLYPWLKSYTPYNDTFLFVSSSKVIELDVPVNKPGIVLSEGNGEILMSTGDPRKAILLKDLETYNFLYSIRELVGSWLS